MSVHVASPVATRQEDAQDHLDALSSVARVVFFPPDPRNLALVLGDSVRVWGILALALNSLYPISTLPEHLHSTILRTPKLPENTPNQRKLVSIPHQRSFPC